jgi:hypothetical protein
LESLTDRPTNRSQNTSRDGRLKWAREVRHARAGFRV